MQRVMTGCACAVAALLLAGGAYAQTADQNNDQNGYTTENPDQNNNSQNTGYSNPDQGNYNSQNTYEEENGYNPGNPNRQKYGVNYNEESGQPDEDADDQNAEIPGAPNTAQNNPPAGTFYLMGNQQSEVADFTSNRDMSICLSRHGRAARFNGRQARSVPLNITWNGNSAMVYPGNCLYFDASHVTVRPAGHLPPGVALHGRVQTYGSYENTR